MRSVLLRITGRVQGVSYRAWTVEQATSFGLRGWVRNRADGSVEVLVIGDDNVVAAMVEACRSGPRFARVADVVATEAIGDGSEGFTAKLTE
jgi:acylphosphatase